MADVDDTKDVMLALVRSDPQSAGEPATTSSRGASARSGALRPLGGDVVDDDADLLRRARQGDRTAFGALYTRHHGRIFAMCSRLLRRSADVDDAVQHTFLEAWRCLDRFEGKSRFTTWLTRIAIHTCLSLRRRLKRLLLANDDGDNALPQLAVLDGGAGEVLHAKGPPDAWEVARQHAISRALDEILPALSAKKRVVFVLADLDGLSSPEVAEILEIPETTVRTRLFYARKEIAQAMASHPILSELGPRPTTGGRP